MRTSAINVLLNGGNAELIGQRPATSQRPKKRANEISCQTTGLTIRFFAPRCQFPEAAENGSAARLRSIARQFTVQHVRQSRGGCSTKLEVRWR